MSRLPKLNPLVKQKLTRAGISPVGTRQVLSGQPVATVSDRNALARLVDQLAAGSNGFTAADDLFKGKRWSWGSSQGGG